jgi:hypothetical protein
MEKDYGLDYYGDLVFKSEYVSPLRSDSNMEAAKVETELEDVGKTKGVEQNERSTRKEVAKYLRKKKIEALVAKSKQKKSAVRSNNKWSDSEDADDEEEDDEVAVPKVANGKAEVKTCEHCDTAPCVMDTHYDEMMLLGSDMEDSGTCSNKEIRHAMYTFMTRAIWGRLGKGVRKKLPKCVVGEIKDAYPAKKGTDYVGFRPHSNVFVEGTCNNADLEL